MFFLLLNGMQYARPKNGGTQYTRPKEDGTQYARGEGGVTLFKGQFRLFFLFKKLVLYEIYMH